MALTDMAGQEIQVGDTLAVGIMRYRSAELRVGEVIKIGPDHLGMVWLLGPGEEQTRWRVNKSTIQTGGGKYLKVSRPVDFTYPEW